MKPILEIRNISKKFRIRHQEPYLSLRDKFAGLWQPARDREDFWALKDVSFDVNPGDSVGIIGRNGAGKSTLLKILSKITPPSAGRIVCRGRVASLLEVGTGFHPELTGRENIFLNGSILGMKRHEIIRHFDAIVDFAGTGNFLDTPLKHYSSGMQLRLAFSVAAFLEPEIMIIDEVLAVGDAEFQKKCLGKMEEVSKSGRTILFVSHNMAAVEGLCRTGVLLNDGRVEAIGPSSQVTQSYLKGHSNATNPADQYFPGKNGKAQITRLEFLSADVHTETLYMGGDLKIKMHYCSEAPLKNPLMGMILHDSMGAPLLFFNNKNYGAYFINFDDREGIMSLHIEQLNLMPGFYSIDIYLANMFEDLDVKKGCFTFQVIYKHFTDAGEPLQEKFNKIFYKNVTWDLNKLG